MNEWEHADIQGIVFSSYGDKMHEASYHLLRIGDPPRANAWLADLVHRVTPGMTKPIVPQASCLNVAFTRSGLEKLGVAATTIDATFEPAFQDGMISKRRTRILGDTGTSAPEEWQWGNESKPVDVLLLLFAPNPEALKALEADEAKTYAAHGLSLVVDPIAATPLDPKERFSREHFGFADGISQPKPVIANTEPELNALLVNEHQAVPAGEFVFGYTNAYWNETIIPGWKSVAPGAKPLGLNGTYLVVRQFEQDVSAFWNFLRTTMKHDEKRTEWLAAKMVGRWPSGALVREGERTDPGLPANGDDAFDFTDDPRGTGAPIGSHVRRSNPRGTELADDRETSLVVAGRHRVLRRARSYGPFAKDKYVPDNLNRGLMFIGLNTNIERQFEFIMHSWMHNPVFGSLYQETDPLIGDPSRIVDPQSQKATTTPFSIPTKTIRERIPNIPRFVTAIGGAYFFLPGLDAIRKYLAATQN